MTVGSLLLLSVELSALKKTQGRTQSGKFPFIKETYNHITYSSEVLLFMMTVNHGGCLHQWFYLLVSGCADRNQSKWCTNFTCQFGSSLFCLSDLRSQTYPFTPWKLMAMKCVWSPSPSKSAPVSRLYFSSPVVAKPMSHVVLLICCLFAFLLVLPLGNSNPRRLDWFFVLNSKKFDQPSLPVMAVPSHTRLW